MQDTLHTMSPQTNLKSTFLQSPYRILLVIMVAVAIIALIAVYYTNTTKPAAPSISNGPTPAQQQAFLKALATMQANGQLPAEPSAKDQKQFIADIQKDQVLPTSSGTATSSGAASSIPVASTEPSSSDQQAFLAAINKQQ